MIVNLDEVGNRMNPHGGTTLTIPAALAEEIQAAAAEEHRMAADVVRDALEVYLEGRHWRAHSDHELVRARQLGLPDDAMSLTPEYRRTVRDKIAQAMRSLREGRGTDGEAFFARLDAELEELESQRRK